MEIISKFWKGFIRCKTIKAASKLDDEIQALNIEEVDAMAYSNYIQIQITFETEERLKEIIAQIEELEKAN